MTIRTQFILTLIVFTAVLSTIGASLVAAGRKNNRLQTASAASHTLELEIREFSYLFNDFLFHGEVEQLRRWQLKFASFSRNLDEFAVDDPVVANLVAEMAMGRTSLAEVFAETTRVLNNLSAAVESSEYLDLLRLSWSRMEIQNQALAHNASRISRHLDTQAKELQQRVTILLFTLVGFFGVFLLTLFITFHRRVLTGIEKLQKGAAIIGSGNLHHTIEETKNDEIGALTRAFNTMTTDLLDVIISKEELEREISERLRVEKALRKSETKYRMLFENITEEVHFWQLVRDQDGNILTWRLVDANPPALRTWGFESLEEIRGKTTDEIFGSGATEHYLPIVEKIMTEGTPYAFEDYFPHLYKHFHFTSVPLDEHFITTGTDVSELKQSAEALRQSNLELDQFASAASHDLKEPLRVISNYLTLLQRKYSGSLDDTGRLFIDKSLQTAQRMEKMIRQLLDLSRINNYGGDFAVCDMNEIVALALEDLQTIVREKRVEIIVSQLFNATVDSGQIRRLFQNLITNGIKYNDTDRPVIEIGYSEDSSLFRVWVRDNGIGIDPEYHQSIFLIFQRLQTSREYSGTGIGLAICKKIVDRHGGRIWVESHPGEGSTFYFTLPKKRS